MKDHRSGISAVAFVVALALAACSSSKDGADAASSTGGSGGSGGSAGSGGSGGIGGTGGSGGVATGGSGGGADAAPRDTATSTEGGAAPSAQFITIYDTILKTRCAPCHTTQMPRAGGLDLGDAPTAFAALTGGMTTCVTVMPKARVVPGAPNDSYLIKKLTGAMGICGMRMPRLCVASAPDGGSPTDAAAGSPCLSAADVATISAWIMAGAK